MYNILLVEDDAVLGNALSEYLKLKNFQVYWAQNSQKARQLFDLHPIQLCLLDLGIPGGMDGFELARVFRRLVPHIPLLFLTARSLKADKLRGFAVGADDYLVKPIDEEELVARIHAVLRRQQTPDMAQPKRVFQIGAYHFDPANHQLSLQAKVRQLTSRESYLLELLCESKGSLLARERVLKSVWRQNDYFTRRSMDVFISRLRKYLSEDPSIRIENVYGAGFILHDQSTANSAGNVK